MDFKKLYRSFEYAFSGILRLVKSEQNAKMHLLVRVLVVTAGFVLKISGSEWCVVLILIALVWAAEAFNTVIERLTDHLFHGYHKTARIVKDVSAGGGVDLCNNCSSLWFDYFSTENPGFAILKQFNFIKPIFPIFYKIVRYFCWFHIKMKILYIIFSCQFLFKVLYI